MRLAARQSEQCSGDLRDGRQQSSANLLGNGATIAPRPNRSTELVSDDLPVFHSHVRWGLLLRPCTPLISAIPDCQIFLLLKRRHKS